MLPPSENYTHDHPRLSNTILAWFDGLLLVTAYTGTSLIQADAIRAEAWLADSSGRIGFSAEFWPAILFLLIVITILRAIGTETEKGNWTRILTDLKILKNWRLGLFFAALFLPQRLMDTNSGYTCIQPESLVSLILLGFDWMRTFATLIWFRRSLSYTFPEPQQPGFSFPPSLISIFTTRRLAILVLVIGLAGQHLFLGGIPRVQDEIIQHWNARLLSQGMVHTPPLPVREPFLPDPSVAENGQWIYSTYQPFFSLLTSLLLPMKLDSLLNPLIGMLSLFLMIRLGRLCDGSQFGSVLGVLFAFSPFLLLMVSSRMNHPLALLCLIVAMNGLASIADGKRWPGGLVTCIAFSALLLTRRVDGVALGLALCSSLLFLKDSRTRRFGLFSMFALSGAIAWFIQGFWTTAVAGDSLLAIRHAQVALSGFDLLSWGLLWSNNIDNILGFSGWAFGGILAGWAGFAFLARKSDQMAPTGLFIERFLVIHSIFILLGYSWYYFQDFCYGPRYLFPLLPAATFGCARFIQSFFGSSSGVLPANDTPANATPSMAFLGHTPHRRDASRFLMVTIGVSLLVTCQTWWSLLSRDFWHIRPETAHFITDRLPDPSLIFLRHPARIRLSVVRQLRSFGVSNALLLQAISSDAVDYDALLEELSRLSPISDEAKIREVVYKALQAAKGRRPEEFSINGMEVIRLNEPGLATGTRIIALDLGDEPNSAIKASLPTHSPMFLYRRGNEYYLASDSLSGLARFDEPRGPAGSEYRGMPSKTP